MKCVTHTLDVDWVLIQWVQCNRPVHDENLSVIVMTNQILVPFMMFV